MAKFIQRPKGTQDILPKDENKWRTVEQVVSDCAEVYGFKEIRTPVFEETGLYQRSVGDTSDVVTKEMYTVSSKGSHTYSLRPEGTAGVVRAMLENGLLNEGLPKKVYYIAPFFRHERPQAGRLREFHQFGAEVFGAASPYADAEIIMLARDILNNCGITGLTLNINSIGCPECRKNYQKALVEYFGGKKECLCEDCIQRLDKNPMRLLDCKVPSCKEAAKDAPIILDYLCGKCREHFEKLKEILSGFSVLFTVNPRIVRGLDYYTKTVFEFISQSIGAQGTVCGGGRYDGLVSSLGGQPTPALGFGMGLERLILVMENTSAEFMDAKTTDLYIAPMGERAYQEAAVISQKLRENGVSAEFDIVGRGLKPQMRYADKTGAKFVLVLGDNELDSESVNVKNMQNGEQASLPLSGFAQAFSDTLIAFKLANELDEYGHKTNKEGK